jgi:hypothetical protein
MKKYLVFGLVGFALAACSDRVESPMEFVKATTINDTYDFCMKANGNKAYCKCEVADLEKNFPWKDYMAAIDILAGEENHVAGVIKKHGGNRKKILAELNCDTCYFAVALGAVNISPSPKCGEILNAEIRKCIDGISGLVACAGSCSADDHFAGLSFEKDGKVIGLTADQAIAISPNWDYKNPRFYQNNPDSVVRDYEMDACETLDKLERFIAEYK